MNGHEYIYGPFVENNNTNVHEWSWIKYIYGSFVVIHVLMPKIDFFLFLSGAIVKICTFAVRIAGKVARSRHH